MLGTSPSPSISQCSSPPEPKPEATTTTKKKMRYDLFSRWRKTESFDIFNYEISSLEIYCSLSSNKIMPFSPYQATPDRFNPQFIGIAGRYSHKKQTRLKLRQERKSMESTYRYAYNHDQSLRKTLEQKTIELEKYKNARARHLKELQEKVKHQIQQKSQLQQLKNRNQANREKSKIKRQAAKKALLNHIYGQKQSCESQRLMMQSLHQTMKNLRNHRNEELYERGKEGYLMAQRHINSFHRRRNTSAVRDYEKKIEMEDSLNADNEKAIEFYRRETKKFEKSIEVKSKALKELENELKNYRANPRSLVRGRNQNILSSQQSFEFEDDTPLK